MNQSDRDSRFMREALQDALAALERQEFPVGCVLVYRNRVIAHGHRRHSTGKGLLELDHAEIMALRQLDRSGREYKMEQVIAYSTLEPCLMCYAALLLNGIRRIVYAYEDVMGGGTTTPLKKLTPLYLEMNVRVVPHVLRSESLALIKTFFSNPDCTYWQDSLLARYSLEQP